MHQQQQQQIFYNNIKIKIIFFVKLIYKSFGYLTFISYGIKKAKHL
jgi:hypothetical protein